MGARMLRPPSEKRATENMATVRGTVIPTSMLGTLPCITGTIVRRGAPTSRKASRTTSRKFSQKVVDEEDAISRKFSRTVASNEGATGGDEADSKVGNEANAKLFGDGDDDGPDFLEVNVEIEGSAESANILSCGCTTPVYRLPSAVPDELVHHMRSDQWQGLREALEPTLGPISAAMAHMKKLKQVTSIFFLSGMASTYLIPKFNLMPDTKIGGLSAFDFYTLVLSLVGIAILVYVIWKYCKVQQAAAEHESNVVDEVLSQQSAQHTNLTFIFLQESAMKEQKLPKAVECVAKTIGKLAGKNTDEGLQVETTVAFVKVRVFDSAADGTGSASIEPVHVVASV